MPQTAEGAKKAATTKRRRYDPDYFKKLGRLGGLKSGGSFKKGDKSAVVAGRKGAAKRWRKVTNEAS